MAGPGQDGFGGSSERLQRATIEEKASFRQGAAWRGNRGGERSVAARPLNEDRR